MLLAILTASVSFSFVHTGSRQAPEALVFSGGALFKSVETIFSAVLVKHDERYFLFDTGLGRDIATQYAADMPLWRRPFFRYEDPITPAADQLKGVAIDTIVLSHAHWDHASGLHDFPNATVMVAAEELAAIQHPHGGVGGAWPSQTSGVNWKTIPFVDGRFDMFGDGSVVFLQFFGHTPGSVGMLLNSAYLFVGDVVWNAAALPEGRPKMWLARQAADWDADLTASTIARIREMMRAEPNLVVVAAHDGSLQRALGLFPRWH